MLTVEQIGELAKVDRDSPLRTDGEAEQSHSTGPVVEPNVVTESPDGASRGSLQRVGRSGDGGIDGIISLDRLGPEKVYVQAKRWQASVGRPDVQAFYGALAGRRAKKGVFITTSSYTREAREFANTVSDTMVIVDGARLAALMIEHGVGVSHEPIRIARVDSDYFDDA